jgi:hypothetical protein
MISFTQWPKGQITLEGLLQTESQVVALHLTKVGILGMVLGGCL